MGRAVFKATLAGKTYPIGSDRGGDLGDESVPMTLLYGGMVLAAISAVIVHWKRMRIQ